MFIKHANVFMFLIRTGGVLNRAHKFVRSVGQDAPKYMCHFKVRNNPECPSNFKCLQV